MELHQNLDTGGLKTQEYHRRRISKEPEVKNIYFIIWKQEEISAKKWNNEVSEQVRAEFGENRSFEVESEIMRSEMVRAGKKYSMRFGVARSLHIPQRKSCRFLRKATK